MVHSFLMYSSVPQFVNKLSEKKYICKLNTGLQQDGNFYGMETYEYNHHRHRHVEGGPSLVMARSVVVVGWVCIFVGSLAYD